MQKPTYYDSTIDSSRIIFYTSLRGWFPLYGVCSGGFVIGYQIDLTSRMHIRTFFGTARPSIRYLSGCIRSLGE